MSRLLVTEQARICSRFAWAMLEGAGADASAPALICLAPTGHTDAALIERLGVTIVPAAAVSAPTVEAAIAGTCALVRPSVISIWDSTRAILAMPAVRAQPDRPEVEVHIAPDGAVPWDEARLVAIRANGLVDRYVVEDDASAERLMAAGVRPHQIATPSVGQRSPTPGGEGAAGVCLVHGMSWERRSAFAERLATDLTGQGVAARAADVATLTAELIAGGSAPSHLVLVERHVASLALARSAQARGARVAAGDVVAGPSALTPGLRLGDDESQWSAAICEWASA